MFASMKVHATSSHSGSRGVQKHPNLPQSPLPHLRSALANRISLQNPRNIRRHPGNVARSDTKNTGCPEFCLTTVPAIHQRNQNSHPGWETFATRQAPSAFLVRKHPEFPQKPIQLASLHRPVRNPGYPPFLPIPGRELSQPRW